MKIGKVSVRYGELRSTGYPNFSNKRVEIELEANLEAGDIPQQVKDRLLINAQDCVKQAFGEKGDDSMEIPF